MTPAQAKDVKDILNEVAKFGLYKMTTSAKMKAAKMMLFHHMKMDDAVQLYNKYVGDWGGSATTYRFEAIKDGKVVKELIIRPMTEVKIMAETDHTILKEETSYDVASVRIKALDENGNLLYYFNDPLQLQIEGDAEIVTTPHPTLTEGKVGDSRVVVKCAPVVYDKHSKYPGVDSLQITINDNAVLMSGIELETTVPGVQIITDEAQPNITDNRTIIGE